MSEFDTEQLRDEDAVAEGIMPDLFTVTVKGTGVELTRPVDQATALAVISTVLTGGSASPPASPAYVPQTPSGSAAGTQRDTADAAAAANLDPDMTIGEYIDDCDARQFPAKITAIGRFLELKLGQSSFTKDEIKSQFRPAGEALPTNFSRDFSEAITQRWIAEVPGESGQYFVPKTGKAAIAAKFDRSTRRATPARRRRTSKSDNASTTSDATADTQNLDDDE